MASWARFQAKKQGKPNLHKKQIVDKTGKHTTVYVLDELHKLPIDELKAKHTKDIEFYLNEILKGSGKYNDEQIVNRLKMIRTLAGRADKKSFIGMLQDYQQSYSKMEVEHKKKLIVTNKPSVEKLTLQFLTLAKEGEKIGMYTFAERIAERVLPVNQQHLSLLVDKSSKFPVDKLVQKIYAGTLTYGDKKTFDAIRAHGFFSGKISDSESSEMQALYGYLIMKNEEENVSGGKDK